MTKKLSFEIIGYIFIAAIGAIFSYMFIHAAALSLGSKVLLRSETFQSYVEEGSKELVTILKNDSEQERLMGNLLKWNLQYPELQIHLYKGDELYYTSPDLIERYYEGGDSYHFQVQTPYGVEKVELYPCYTKQFIRQMSKVSGMAAGMLFIFFMLFMCHYKFKYLLKINDILKEMEEGDLKKRIPLEGEDELTQVAQHINVLATRIEQEIEEEKRLAAQNRQMVSSLSHDIRTPLTAIMSYLNFLEKDMYSSPEQMKEYLHIASQKALQIKGVTDTLFSYVGVEKSKETKKNQLFEAHILAEQILLEIGDWLESCGFDVIYENTMTKGDTLSIDLILLRRVLDNFCSNIEKYADKLKPVQVSIEKVNQQFVLSLTNTIHFEERERESYGIGLENCKEIIESYKGQCKIYQNEFTFQVIMALPLQNSLDLSIENLQN